MILAGIAVCQLLWQRLQYSAPENSHTRLVSKNKQQ